MTNRITEDSTSTRWIENLAMEEVTMEESGVIHFSDHLDPKAHLEDQSLIFMDQLKERFEFYVERFNHLRSQRDLNKGIRIFKISNTVNDFMLYRNSLKLIVSRKALDVISVGFLSNTGGVFSARLAGQTAAIPGIHEIKAHLGAFHKLTWRFQGEEIDLEALVQHHLTEFIKHSAR